MRRFVAVWTSIEIASGGIMYVLRHERNVRIESGVALLVIFLGLWLRVDSGEWIGLLLAISLVLSLELLNTAIEACVDLTCPNLHPLAKVAKDTAAGAVLMGTLGSVCVGLITFGPRLWTLLTSWL